MSSIRTCFQILRDFIKLTGTDQTEISNDIHFFYSADEALYGAKPEFEAACRRAGVPYTMFARPGMVHCYCMLPYFKEAKEDFAKIVDILKK